MNVLLPHGEPQRTKRAGALIELKPGGPRNFFLVHDGDGDTQLYLKFARHMPDDVAVFGIPPRSITGVPLAHARIEDMASHYVQEIRNQQPHGPYLLGGLCAGGVIAYEMASQLTRAGEVVELVALLDAARPQARKRRWRISRQRFDRLKQVLTDRRNRKNSTIRQMCSVAVVVSRKLLNALTWEISHRLERWWVRARFRLLRQVLSRQLPWPGFIPELKSRQIYESAEAQYVPKPLRGVTVVLVRPRHHTCFPSDTPYREIYADETLGWGAIAQDIAFVDVDGGHGTMLQEPFVRSVATALLPI